MGKIKLFFLSSILLYCSGLLFPNENTDKYCGTWVSITNNKIIASVSICKIQDDVYYVIYNEKRVFYDSRMNKISDFYSFAEYAFASDNKITINTTKYFDDDVYFTIQKIEENLFVMCNHDEYIYPYNETDYVFHRVKYQPKADIKQQELENAETLKNSVVNSIFRDKKN